jgi:hypothetical protein
MIYLNFRKRNIKYYIKPKKSSVEYETHVCAFRLGEDRRSANKIYYLPYLDAYKS